MQDLRKREDPGEFESNEKSDVALESRLDGYA